MRRKIFPWLCTIFFCVQILKANMVVGAIWCLMVCYQISHAEHKLSHRIYFVIWTEMQPSNSQSYTIFHLHAFPVQEHVSNFPSSSVWQLGMSALLTGCQTLHHHACAHIQSEKWSICWYVFYFSYLKGYYKMRHSISAHPTTLCNVMIHGIQIPSLFVRLGWLFQQKILFPGSLIKEADFMAISFKDLMDSFYWLLTNCLFSDGKSVCIIHLWKSKHLWVHLV